MGITKEVFFLLILFRQISNDDVPFFEPDVRRRRTLKYGPLR
jgi:hypothetical protein